MKGLLKKIAIGGSSLTLLAGLASAQVGNMTTGPDSENNASVRANNETEVELDNDSHIQNMVHGMLTTGCNEVEDNTEAGDIDTGNVSATVSATTRANESAVSVTAPAFLGADFDVVNDTTGPDSVNNAWVRLNNETEVEVDNYARIDNHVDVTADTGHNEIEHNTTAGSISTGNASLNVNYSNTINSTSVTSK